MMRADKLKNRIITAILTAILTVTCSVTGFPLVFTENSNWGLSDVYAATGTKKITVIKTWVNDDDSVRPSNLTIHIKKTDSYLLTGTAIEAKMKQLSGSGGVNTDNTTVTAIRQATDAEYQAIKSSLTSNNEVQSSGEKTYMWYSGGTIYVYSEADNVYLNSDSGAMFRKFANLTDISGLAMFNTSYVTDMNRMFQSDLKIADFSPLAGWNVKYVQNFNFTFGAAGKSNASAEPMAMNNFEFMRNWDVSNATNFDQAFKGCSHVPSLEPIKDWKVSKVTNFNQAFNWCVGLDDSTRAYIDGWDVRAVTNFKQMFDHADATPTKPDFSLRPGTWDSNGTYTPDDSPITPATPDTPSSPPTTSSTEYANNGVSSGNCTVTKGVNDWSYEFEVADDGSKWSVWEDTSDGSHLDDKNGLAAAYTESSGGTDGLGGSEANAITDVTDQTSIINTNTKRKEITFKKTWDDDNDALGRRPSDLDVSLYLNGSAADRSGNDSSKWVKSGNTWTYEFVHYSDKDVTDYSVKEESVPNYYSCQAPGQTASVARTSQGGDSLQTGTADITNKLGTGSITIGKETSGNQGDKTKAFTVTITIKKAHPNSDYQITTVAGTPSGPDKLTTDASGNGSATFYLKDTDKVKINDLEAGAHYVVEEQAETYENNARVSGSQIVERSPGGTRVKDNVSGLGVDEDAIITFVNQKVEIIPTGIFSDGAPWMLLLVITVIMGTFLAGLTIRRKWDEI